MQKARVLTAIVGAEWEEQQWVDVPPENSFKRLKQQEGEESQ